MGKLKTFKDDLLPQSDEEDNESHVLDSNNDLDSKINDDIKKEIIKQLQNPQSNKDKSETPVTGKMTAVCVVQGHAIGEVWGLATHPFRNVAITASDDGTIRSEDYFLN